MSVLGGTLEGDQRCGTAGCHRCEPRTRAKSVSGLKHFLVPRGMGAWLATFTIRGYTWTVEERDAAIARMSATVRSATRDGRGIWLGGCWFAEVTPHPEAGYTSIPCPFRAGLPASLTEGSGDRGPQEVQAVERSARLVAACRSGQCELCHGSGTLPAGNLHFHALVIGPPVYWGAGKLRDASVGVQARADVEGWRTLPGGLGLQGWGASLGWDNIDMKALDAAEAGAVYVAKGVKEYVAKGSHKGSARLLYQAAFLRTVAPGGGVVRTCERFGALRGLVVQERDPAYSIPEIARVEPAEASIAAAERALLDAALERAAVPRVVVLQGRAAAVVAGLQTASAVASPLDLVTVPKGTSAAIAEVQAAQCRVSGPGDGVAAPDDAPCHTDCGAALSPLVPSDICLRAVFVDYDRPWILRVGGWWVGGVGESVTSGRDYGAVLREAIARAAVRLVGSCLGAGLPRECRRELERRLPRLLASAPLRELGPKVVAALVRAVRELCRDYFRNPRRRGPQWRRTACVCVVRALGGRAGELYISP